jgi:hypothetical protein
MAHKFVSWGKGLVAFASENADPELVSELLCGSLYNQVTEAIETANDELNFDAAVTLGKARDMLGFDDYANLEEDKKPRGRTVKFVVESKNTKPEFMAFVGKFLDKNAYIVAKSDQSYTCVAAEDEFPGVAEKLAGVGGIKVSSLEEETKTPIAPPATPPVAAPVASADPVAKVLAKTKKTR